MRTISIRIPEWMLQLIDKLIEKRIFISRSEFIRYAARLALKKYEYILQEQPQNTQKKQNNNQTPHNTPRYITILFLPPPIKQRKKQNQKS